MKFALGELLNHLSRANVSIVASPIFDPKFPTKNLSDGIPEKYGRWKDLTADPRVTVDLNLIKGGAFPTSALTGWKKTGTAVTDAAVFHTAARSAKLTNNGFICQDIVLRAGESLKFSAWIRGDGASGTLGFQIQDLTSGRYLGSDLEWASAQTYFATRAANTFAEATGVFKAEAFSVVFQHETTIRLTFKETSGAGSAWVDDIWIAPGTNCVAFIGVGFPAVLVPTLYGSDDGSFSGSFQEGEVDTPSFAMAFDMVHHRYIRVTLVGTPAVTPCIGDLILTQLETLSKTASYGAQLKADWPAAAKAGAKPVSRQAQNKTAVLPVRTVTLDFALRRDGQWTDEHLQWFIRRCRSDREDILLVLPELDPGLVLYGGLSGSRGHSKVGRQIRQTLKLVVTEDSFARTYLTKPVGGDGVLG